MVTRTLSALIALPLLLVLIISGGFTLKISMVIVSIIGMSEIYKAISKKILE